MPRQWPQSIRVPFLFRLPSTLAAANGRELPLLMDAPDIMPTLLGLCELPIPSTVQGRDLSAVIAGIADVDPEMSCLLKVPVGLTTQCCCSATMMELRRT